MARLEVRISDELQAALESTAERSGLSKSDITREALAIYIAWHRALDAVDAGHKTDELRDPATIARLLSDTK